METGTIGKSQTYANSFNANKFNAEFELEKDITTYNGNNNAQLRLNKLNTEYYSTPLRDYTIYGMARGLFDTWMGIMNDLLNLNITEDILTKNNRLFFIGLTFIIAGIIAYLYYFFKDELENEKLFSKQ